MGLYRDESGRVIEIDDRFAEARGYTPLSPLEHEGINAQRGLDARGTERGIVGSVNAAATGLASGLTLGGSDYLLGKVLPDGERERLLAELDAHPGLRTAGEVGGALVGAFATGGSSLARTPAGYLGATAQRAIGEHLAVGGIKGTAKAIGVMGAEGAAQSAGQYIGYASLRDKEVTAEGLTGALGTGFAFGAVGGGAALGVANGVMAGRRMFSRVMEGKKAAQAAESSWSIAAQESLEADMATARIAETRLEDFRKGQMEALRGRNEARSAAQEAALDAQGARAAKAAPEDVPVTGAADFGAQVDGLELRAPGDALPSTTPRAHPMPEPLPARPVLEDAPVADPADLLELHTQAAPVRLPKGQRGVKPKDATDLEAQLAGTKAKLDKGTAWKDIQGDPTKPPRKFNEDDPLDLDDVGIEMLGEARRGGRTKEGLLKTAADLRARTQQTLSEIRYKTMEDLVGAPAAKAQQRLADVVDEFHAARKDFEGLLGAGPISDGIPLRRAVSESAPIKGFTDPNATGAASPGKRQAIEIVDDAHEEALLRVKHAADPQEAGQAVREAEELENLLEGLTASHRAPSDGVPKAWSDELVDAVKKVERYEKASAAMADEVGDVAHPVSTEKTKALREAEKDSERKMYDRTARATDDAADGIHPKVSAAKAAKKAQIDAQRKLDDLNVQHQEARHDFSNASKKVRDGEKLKKGALREDAKLARAATKDGADTGDFGTLLEMIDIPGMPKPSDLPIIGPLLGAYLKFRTMKKVLGKRMGKVPATADARVAALASQTRDRVARAVDRSLGALERGAKGLAKVAPPVAGVLAHRIYDDGLPDEKKGADIQDLAAARMRELAAYVHTPGAIERDVRRQLAEVTDPDLITAAEVQRRAQMEYLLSVAPKMPEPNLLNPIKYRPAPARAMSFARSMAAVGDPAGVFEALAHERAMISLEAAEALRRVYPRIFSEAGARLMERAQEGNLKVPMRMRVQMSMLYKVPLDAALDPDNLKITQSVYDRKVMQPAPGMQGAPSTPSIANPVNLSQGLTPAADRS